MSKTTSGSADPTPGISGLQQTIHGDVDYLSHNITSEPLMLPPYAAINNQDIETQISQQPNYGDGANPIHDINLANPCVVITKKGGGTQIPQETFYADGSDGGNTSGSSNPNRVRAIQYANLGTILLRVTTSLHYGL